NNIFGNYIGACFLYRSEVFHRNNGYNENFFLVEDYDFWLRAMIHSKFSHISESLYFYRKHDNTLTAQISNKELHKQIWKDNVSKMYKQFIALSAAATPEFADFLTDL